MKENSQYHTTAAISRYLSESEVAELIGRSVAALRKDRHFQRGLPYFRFGKQIRYSVADVHQHMQGCRVVPRQMAA